MKILRRLHSTIERPSTKYYKCYMSNNGMVNYPIFISNENTTYYIFGKYEGYLQGKILGVDDHMYGIMWIM